MVDLGVGEKKIDIRSKYPYIPYYQASIVESLISDLDLLIDSIKNLENEFLKVETNGDTFSEDFILNIFKKNVELKGSFLGIIASAHYLFLDDIEQKEFLENLICMNEEDIKWFLPPSGYGLADKDMSLLNVQGILQKFFVVYCKEGLKKIIDSRSKFLEWPNGSNLGNSFIFFESKSLGNYVLRENHFICYDGKEYETKLASYTYLLKHMDNNNYHLAMYVLYILLKMCGFKDDNIRWTNAMIEPTLVSESGFYDKWDIERRKPLKKISYDDLNSKFKDAFSLLDSFEKNRVIPNQICNLNINSRPKG